MTRPELKWDTFIQMAGMLGLDPEDPHMEDLYPWVKQVLRAIEPLEELNVNGVEPALGFAPGQEE